MDTEALLTAVERAVPTSITEWPNVATICQEIAKETSLRDPYNLKCQFHKLRSKLKDSKQIERYESICKAIKNAQDSKKGSKQKIVKFTPSTSDILLDVIEEILPTNLDEWKCVSSQYHQKSLESEARHPVALRDTFLRSFCTEGRLQHVDVDRAKHLRQQILLKSSDNTVNKSNKSNEQEKASLTDDETHIASKVVPRQILPVIVSPQPHVPVKSNALSTTEGRSNKIPDSRSRSLQSSHVDNDKLSAISSPTLSSVSSDTSASNPTSLSKTNTLKRPLVTSNRIENEEPVSRGSAEQQPKNRNITRDVWRGHQSLPEKVTVNPDWLPHSSNVAVQSKAAPRAPVFGPPLGTKNRASHPMEGFAQHAVHQEKRTRELQEAYREVHNRWLGSQEVQYDRLWAQREAIDQLDQDIKEWQEQTRRWHQYFAEQTTGMRDAVTEQLHRLKRDFHEQQTQVARFERLFADFNE